MQGCIHSLSRWLTHPIPFLFTAGKFTANRRNAVTKSPSDGQIPTLPSKYAIKIIKKAALDRAVEKYALTRLLVY